MAKIMCRYCKHEKANLTADCAFCNTAAAKTKWNIPNRRLTPLASFLKEKNNINQTKKAINKITRAIKRM